MTLPATFALLLALGQIPLATETQLPTGEKVTLAADQLLYEPAKETLIARGHTVLSTDRVTLRADEIIYDQANQQATARGNVMLVAGLLAAVADEVTIDIRSLEANVVGGLFLKKRNVTEAQLLAAKTPYELKKTGETVLTLTGTRIKKVGKDNFLVDGLSFTPCDCDPTEPSWRVEANTADVELGERAILTWPVVYVYQVPVFALPWLYLPLSERRSGLLVPRPNFSQLAGFSLEQPIFLTLGESYDMTFTPGYYFGGRREQPFGIRGARMHTELRYVPSATMSGRSTVGLLYDLQPRRDPRFPTVQLGQPRGLRTEASWQHLQDLGNGWRNRVDLGFVSDGYYFRDVTADVLARQSDYLRSTAVLNHKDAMSYFGIEALVRQPVHTDSQLFGFDAFREDRDLAGNVIAPPRTFARLPAITWSMPERSLVGPLWGGLTAQYTRLAPVVGSFGDEGTDGVFRYCNPGAPVDQCEDPVAPGATQSTQGDRKFDPGERDARDRIDLRPQLSVPLAGKYARLTPYLGFRETLYLSEVTGKAWHRGYPLAGAMVGTTLLRDFGTAEDGLRHTISPEAQTRYVPFAFISESHKGFIAYDEVDQAIRPSAYEAGMWQAVVELRQTLEKRQGGGRHELLQLDLGQGMDLKSANIVADTFARILLRQGPLSVAAVARYDLPRQRTSQISAQLNLDNGRGTNLYVNYDNLLDVGSDQQRAGIDELVGQPLSEVPFSVAGSESGEATFRRAEQITGGFRTRFGFGLGLRYDALIQPAAVRKVPQQVVGVSYGPGCDCWRLEVHAVVQSDPARPPAEGVPGALGWPFLTPSFGASLSISHFGQFGTGG